MMASLTVTQLRSRNGANSKQLDTLRSLGLRRIGHTVQVNDTPQARGMLHAVRHLVEVGELQREGDRRDVADVLTTSLPTTVVEVVRRRVQRLGEPVERMLAAAAVLGHEFDTLVLADVAGLVDAILPDPVDELLARFVPPPSGHRDWLTVDLPGLS